MRLIHYHHGYLCVNGKIKELLRYQPLGSDIYNGVSSLSCVRERFIILIYRQGAVQIRGMNAGLVQGRYLILH